VAIFITPRSLPVNGWLFFEKKSAMKKFVGFVSMIILLTSCASVVIVDSKPKSGPPGQVKKVTGSQSAKAYAPGQQKKKN
jgi:hypothetical protein